jgi:hypothetical protein
LQAGSPDLKIPAMQKKINNNNNNNNSGKLRKNEHNILEHLIKKEF